MEVSITCRFPFIKHLVCKRYCSGKSCGILVHIECRIKMRYPEGFKRKFIINHHRFTEVCVQQPEVLHADHVKCERLITLHNFMGALLELGEHSLPVEGCPYVVNLPVEDVQGHSRVIPVFCQQVMA